MCELDRCGVAMDRQQQNKDVYNRIAKYFWHSRQFVWDDLKPLARFVKAGDRVLDVGCGSGRLVRLFEPLRVTYVGLDQSEALLTIAKQQFPNLEFVLGDMGQLPFPDASFDQVY